MKKLILAVTLLVSFNTLFASHMAGGEIWYEYAGTAQHPNRYDVYVILYRDISGIPLCPSGNCSIDVCITSSCFPTTTMTANLAPFTLMPGSDTTYGSYPGSIVLPNSIKCVNANSPNLVFTEVYRFHTQVDLPGTCSDFTFASIESSRNSSSNLVGQGYFHIKAKLNNTLGNNTSARFLSSGATSFCAGVPTIWQQKARETEGDSLFYELGQPLDGTCGNSNAIAFASGYNQSNPITTLSGITLDDQKGVLSFTPSQIEVVTINLQVSEYRYNVASDSWYLIGVITRDVQVPIVSNNDCNAQPQTWFGVADSSSNNFTSTLNCNDSVIELAFEEDILTSSIAADATDFSLINSRGLVLPVIATSYPPNLVETRKIKLHLHQPIKYNDTLTLTIRTGTDFNTLQTICSNSIPPGYTFNMHVKDCATWISLDETKVENFMVYPNPAKDVLQISSSVDFDELYCEILDFSGKVVLKQNLKDSESLINIKHLRSGFYLLRINSANGSSVVRFDKKY